MQKDKTEMSNIGVEMAKYVNKETWDQPVKLYAN